MLRITYDFLIRHSLFKFSFFNYKTNLQRNFFKPKKDLLEIRNQPFDGSKALWIPYSDTGYTKAELIGDGDKPGTKKVRRIIDNKEKDMKDEQIEKQNPPKYELLEDLANMTYLSEASVVYNLSERYKIYTFVSYSCSYFIKKNNKNFQICQISDLHLLRPFLRDDQSLQMASSLRQPCCRMLQGKTKI